VTTDARMTARKTLPQRRYAETFELRHGKRHMPFVVTVGYYDDGVIGEIFVTGAKSGSRTKLMRAMHSLRSRSRCNTACRLNRSRTPCCATLTARRAPSSAPWSIDW
jgi:hypothetical protein